MLDIKSAIIGILLGVAIIFSMGASHKKGKKVSPEVGRFQFYSIPNNENKAVILNTSNGMYKIANLGISPNFESGERFMGPPPK